MPDLLTTSSSLEDCLKFSSDSGGGLFSFFSFIFQIKYEVCSCHTAFIMLLLLWCDGASASRGLVLFCGLFVRDRACCLHLRCVCERESVFTPCHAEGSTQDSCGHEMFYAWTALVGESWYFLYLYTHGPCCPFALVFFKFPAFSICDGLLLVWFGGEHGGYRAGFIKDNTSRILQAGSRCSVFFKIQYFNICDLCLPSQGSYCY